MTARLLVVRHGETAWNSERRIQGQLDIPLSEVGKRQARALGKALQAETIARVVSSDLARALHTAQIALQDGRFAVEPDPRWRERHFGTMQGELFEHWGELHAESYRGYLHACDPAPPGGESIATFRARVIAAFESLRHTTGTTLVLTHGGVLNVLYRHACSLPLEAKRTWLLPNTGINEFLRQGDGWQVVRFADVQHLEGAMDELAA